MSTVSFRTEIAARVAAGVPIVWVVTHEETRAVAMIKAALGEGRVSVWTATTGLDGDAQLRAPLRAIAAPDDVRPYRVMCDLHAFCRDAEVVRALRDFAATSKPGAIVVVSPVVELPVEIERDVAVLSLPLPDVHEVAAIFDAELASSSIVASRERFVRAALGLTEAEIKRAYRLAAHEGELAGALDRVVSEKRAALRRSSTLELVAADVTLDQVGGLEVLKAWLRSRALAFDERARAFGLTEPRGMLVSGVQGCGKSLVSKAAARVLGLPLVRLDFADVFSTPSPERAIREATRVLETLSPLVLWIDEIEKGLGEGTTDATQARVFGAFLTWLQERKAPVFVAATANKVDRLPPELARRGRFDEIFFVDLPAAKERLDILRVQLAARGRDPAKFSLDEIATELEHFSGAELAQVVTGALFRAWTSQRDLADADLRAAGRETTPLATLYEEEIQALRAWGKARARRASADRRTLDLFG